MSQLNLSSSYQDLLYLLRCEVRQEKASLDRMDIRGIHTLYELAKKHSVEAMLYPQIKDFPFADSRISQLWKEDYLRAQRKHLVFEAERHQLLAEFKEQGIWYLLLKGSVLSQYYPTPFYRQMTDNDILFDKSCREKVKNIMVKHGYEVYKYHQGYDDIYHKKPFFNFEMHVEISVDKAFKQFIKEVQNRLIQGDDGQKFLTLEDMYIYHMAHEMKHYYISGVGIRYLVDHYYFLKQEKENLNWTFIYQYLSQYHCEDFHQLRDELSYQLFEGNDEEFRQVLENKALLPYCIYGVHGSLEGLVDNVMSQSDSTLKGYYVQKLFPDMDFYEKFYPFVARHKILIPGLALYRLIRGLFRKAAWKELKLLLGKLKKTRER